MTEPAWLGIDLGTQSVRAVALADDGEVLAAASAPLRSRRDAGGRHEQDPAEWWSAVVDVLGEVVAGLPRGAQLRALAVSGTSGTVVPIDAITGEATGAAVMYDDRRGAAELARVEEVGDEVWGRLGYRMQATWALPKMLAMRAAGELPAGSAFAHQPDVIASRLAGRRMPSDLSSALKSGADLDAIGWPSDVFDALGLPVAIVPSLAASGTVIGEVSEAAARETGLPVGCAIVAGMTDGCAAQIAAGALHPGAWNSVLGTTLVLKGASHERRGDATGAVYAHRAPFGGGWYPGGASSIGAGAISAWLPGRDLDALTRDFDADAPSPVAYPLVGRGERFPFVAADAEAFGMPVPDAADDASVFSSILHGVAYAERLSFDLLAATGYDLGGPILLTGGGAQNPVWTQLRADLLGVPVRLPAHSEGAAGMAVLAAAGAAAHAAGGRHWDHGNAALDPLAASADRMLGVPRIIEPDLDRHDRLMPLYVRFVDELERRGWVAPGLALASRERLAA